MRPFEEVIEGFEQQAGLFTTYHQPDTGETYLAIQPEQLNRDFLLIATLESGVGRQGYLAAGPSMTYSFNFTVPLATRCS
ncbi:hypothetical protein XM38_041260 [Halomicronema hongdechloris C2206]|uniref:DUF5118 domain-containing protein n=1 Tax=Halomicronema hongdechloris C2206 TaxID=1641165 RepID=A0A1Z3HS75_9CYAN|nr:DUF5118 domain-containing protein [Halomicronema hongdechloris]ASC73164.1 hypothetical protein XM38_041260 [Halomicronema hongdechloris C2206]